MVHGKLLWEVEISISMGNCERLSFGLMVGVEGFLECSILRFFVIEISHNA